MAMSGLWGEVWLWVDDGVWYGYEWTVGCGVAVGGWWGVVWL